MTVVVRFIGEVSMSKATVSEDTLSSLITTSKDSENPGSANAAQEKLEVWLDDPSLELTQDQQRRIREAL